MAIKSFRPETPTLRFKTVVDYSVLTPKKERPKTPRKLRVSLSSKGGRNTYGRITVRHQGGGHKRNYRLVDFKRDKLNIPGRVASIEYDPNRTAFIALIHYVDGDKRYILAPQSLEVGAQVIASDEAD